ncbi:hypothetical protein GCM10009608_19180 [Pseudonocardia alaniniphila]
MTCVFSMYARFTRCGETATGRRLTFRRDRLTDGVSRTVRPARRARADLVRATDAHLASDSLPRGRAQAGPVAECRVEPCDGSGAVGDHTFHELRYQVIL